MNDADTRIGIPESPDALTAEWLTNAFRAGGTNVSVTTLDVVPIGVGVGIMSLVFRLTPTYEGTPGPASVVVKLAPPWEQIRQIAAGYGFYRREVAIYRELRPRLGLRPAECFYGEFDHESDSFVVVIEDLGGLRSHDQLVGCPIEDARLVVAALARHHGAWWGDASLEQLAYVQSPAEAPWPQFNEQSFKQAWPIILERFGDVVPERIRGVGERWSEAGPAIMKDSVNHPFTLCHGDVRLDNVFFHDDDNPVSVIDWQIANISVGASDLAYFMTQSLALDVRRTYQDELIALYHRTLVEAGVTDYPLVELWEDYRATALLCLAYPVSGGSGELANDRAVSLVRSMLERCIAAIIDTDADHLIGSF